MKGPAPRRARRGRVSGFLLRFGLWVGIPVLLAGGLYAAAELSRSPLGQRTLQYAADRMLDGTARLGLVVTDVKVEGRETTDRDTILAALGAGPGTPILAMNPRRAKEQLSGRSLHGIVQVARQDQPPVFTGARQRRHDWSRGDEGPEARNCQRADAGQPA